MATRRRVVEQHEDWLNLVDPEAPWLSLPVVKRVFPNGLDPTPSEVRAEHKARWYGDDELTAARTAADRSDYLTWLLADVLGWGTDYVTGDALPDDLAAGVERHDVTIRPTGAYRPAGSAPVGLFDETNPGPGSDAAVRLLVFALPAGTDPTARPPGDTWPATWVQRAALACRHNHVPLALVTDGDHLTLVHAPEGGATGWGTWRASEFATEPVLLDSFISVLQARRFVAVADKDTPAALFVESAASQAEVTDQLGLQVRRATELLVNAISRADRHRGGTLLTGVDPKEAYEAAVTVMMRTVFLLVAEENDLLPVDNPHYQQLYAIRTLRESLQQEQFENPDALETRTTAWHRLLATGRAVHSGVHHNELAVPAYGGALFDPDRFPFLEGRTAQSTWRDTPGTPIPITDLDVLAILDALLVLRFASAGGVTDTRRLSYRHVHVEQIGHIYERLLDHGAVPAGEVVVALRGKPGEEPEVALADLEVKQLSGSGSLVAWLSDKAAEDAGRKLGTKRQVERLLAGPIDPHQRASLLQACQSDEVLAARIEPFANLLRLDLRDRPLVFLPGDVYVTETGSRRDSGTAYTTKELADEVAEHALAPLCYQPGPQDTPDTNEWRIRPSVDILDLKVCDPAVGSGAILVAACRYLAIRLVEAWGAEGNPRAADTATAADDPNRLDVVIVARRLVAEHCCYGVDRNPMAVEMAKLSMWLTTVGKDRPFTFLDHAIKSGDSLLGIWDLDQLRHLHYDPATGRTRPTPIPGFSGGGQAMSAIQKLIDEALDMRGEMHSIDTIRPADVERKHKLHRESEIRLAILAAIADVLAGAALTTAGERDPATALTARIEADAAVIVDLLQALESRDEADRLAAVHARAALRLNAGRPDTAPPRVALHWPIAFPEVFDKAAGRQGFDAMVGNPPFIGGQKITGAAGTDYRNHLIAWIANGAKGSADLVAYFFLDGTKVARSFGYLATNTIAQGDTSEVGLTQIIDTGWTIHRAVSSTTWPGDATLEIAKVWATSSPWLGERNLDGRPVVGIDEMLYPQSRSGWRKQRLAANAGKSFQGSIVLGMGFTMSPEEAQALIDKDPRNADVLFPYLGGEDLNQSPTQTAPRWIINFFDWSEERSRQYPDCFAIVEERIKPERAKVKDAAARFWWRYLRPRPELYQKIASLEVVLALCQTSKLQLPALVPTKQVFAHKLVVFALGDMSSFSVLSSGFHWRWVLRHGSTMRKDPVYTPSDVFDTFPLPPAYGAVAATGNDLNEHRASLLRERELGLTDVYNLLHDPGCSDAEVEALRRLHVRLDYAVRDAYGWQNVGDLEHGFHQVRGQGVRFTFAPEVTDEILDRLLELNKERYEAEVAAGLHQPSKAAARVSAGQGSLLEEEEV
ncbi:MAG TPA: DNA methyltransferase [Acidimicrobiales bacterium]|nr:DNA methyltransferase [Acidimicrobiales bacterium]